MNPKKVIVTAGSEYGILCLTRMDGDGNLAGNSLMLWLPSLPIRCPHRICGVIVYWKGV